MTNRQSVVAESDSNDLDVSEGKENIKKTREFFVDNGNKFNIIHDGVEYTINVKDVKHYPRDALEKMVGHLIGETERLEEQLQKKVKLVANNEYSKFFDNVELIDTLEVEDARRLLKDALVENHKLGKQIKLK